MLPIFPVTESFDRRDERGNTIRATYVGIAAVVKYHRVQVYRRR